MSEPKTGTGLSIPWTPEQDALLIERVERRWTLPQIARSPEMQALRPGVTKHGCRNRLAFLGLKTLSSKHKSWPPEIVDAFPAIVREGHTGSQLAAILNERFGTDYTRAAVIKKASMMGLTVGKMNLPPELRPRREPPKRSVRTGQVVRNSGQSSGFPRELRALGEPTEGVPFELLEQRCCKWELGGVTHSPKAFRFCGDPVQDGKPYCAKHWSLSYNPTYWSPALDRVTRRLRVGA